MNNINHILDFFAHLHLEDEDGEALEFSRQPALSENDLVNHEQAAGLRLPEELRSLLMHANGISLFGLELIPAQEQVFYANEGLVSFHDWGNGDHDCIALPQSPHPVGTILFMNHTPQVTVPIARSLSEWLLKAVQEIQSRGALLHPADYRKGHAEGVYHHVLGSLSDVDCELNR